MNTCNRRFIAIEFFQSNSSRLYLLVCLFIGTGYDLSAQPDNGQIYQQLLQDFFNKQPGPYQSIEGRYFRDYFPSVQVDSTVNRTLYLNGFTISYNPLGKKSYLRSIEIPLVIQETDQTLVYQDTLQGKALRKLIRRTPEPFKGEDPTLYSRWFRPAMLVGGSVLGIIGLFFIRSG